MMPFTTSARHTQCGLSELRFGRAEPPSLRGDVRVHDVLMSGIKHVFDGSGDEGRARWDINFSIWVSSITVAIYVALGGLRSAIFNEVLQFLLIWLARC